MRRIRPLLLAWCWLAAATAAVASGHPAPAAESAPLLRGATPADATSTVTATKGHPKTRPVAAKVPVSVKASPASESGAASAPVIHERVDPGEPVDVEDAWLNAPPRETREAVTVEFLRRDRSNFAERVSGEALRDGAFGEIGRKAFALPDVDRAAASGVVRVIHPVPRQHGRMKWPVTEISWAGIALLSFLLARHLLRSWRSNPRQAVAA